jgi:hypothetical protein
MGPPPERTGLALRGGLRLRIVSSEIRVFERNRVAMSVDHFISRQAMPAFPLSGTIRPGARPDSGNSESSSSGMRCSIVSAFLINGFFYFSLWLSLLLALWFTRGWLGLFFSGQVLSVCAYLVKGLARGTQMAFSVSDHPANQFQGEHHVP